MNVSQNNNYYLIQLTPRDPDFDRKLKAVKKLPGRIYIEHKRAWAVPVRTYPSMKQMCNALQNLLQKSQQEINMPVDLTIDPMPELTIDIPLKGEMYEFQKQGCAYNLRHGSSLNGDQQGLGKTIETIATVIAMDLFPCLVITRKGLIKNWVGEWNNWTDKRAIEFKKSTRNTWHLFFSTKCADVGIVNYESLQQYFVEKIEVPEGEEFRVKHIKFRDTIRNFKSIIIDESHYVKDGKTNRTKFCIGLTRHLVNKGVFLLSGTPVLNDPLELYTQLIILNRQHLFGSLPHFKKNFEGKNNRNNLKHLNYLLHKHCYFRRTKQEVRKDMPPKTRQVVLCEIDNREEYHQAENHFIKYLREKLELTQGQIDTKLRGEAMIQMGILKKIIAKGKLAAIKEWTKDIIDQGEKVVLFAYHKEIQTELATIHSRAVRLGDLPTHIKQANKEYFQNGGCPLIVCSISADAEGHTLNAASNLGMCELPWHFGKFEQCEDRIHRITNWLPANIYTFLGDKTIDRDIYDVIMDKKDMHENVTGTSDDIEEKVIDKLINLFNQK